MPAASPSSELAPEAERPPTLAGLAAGQGHRFAAGVLALLATNGLGLTAPWLLARAIDALHGGRPDAPEVVARSALAILILAVAQAAIRTASRLFVFNAAREIEYRLRGELFAAVLATTPERAARRPTGEWMSRLTSDVTAVRMLLGPGVLNFVNTAIVYACGVTLLARLHGRLTLYALAPLPVLIAVTRLWSRRIYRDSQALQAQMGALSAHLQEDLTGIATLRTHGLGAVRGERFARHNRAYLDRALALARSRGALGPLFATAGGLGTLIVLWVGGAEVIAGRLSIGELVAFNATLAYLAWPTLAFGWVLSLWQRGLAGWGRVRELLAAPRATDPPGAVEPLDTPVIEARGLTVTRDGRPVLEDLCFTLRPGRTLAVVGPTGSGKSTLCDALLGLVDVPRGQLFADGVDLLDVKRSAWRRRLAYAPQDAFLFSATLDENIAFGRPDADGLAPAEAAAARARRLAAAHAAGLARDLEELPEGLDTPVGERGITLSGGQRQRVALARALYCDAPVLLLDDALSSVDARTEREILHALAPIARARTTLLVSHRVAAVRDADEILVLDRGRAVARGTHDELVQAGGVYARLYREQLGQAPEAERAP